MSDEAKENAAENQTDEVAAKAQEVSKKLSGFLGGIAEKAKNIDMKDLAEKAKQKVSEAKDKANELSVGKTEDFAQPREEISLEQMKELFHKMSGKMIEQMPPLVEAMLMDMCVGDQMIYKILSGASSDTAALALTTKSLLCFSKVSEQYSCTVYPLTSVQGFFLQPPRGETAGRFAALTDMGEARFPLLSIESYCKALVLYRKLRELTGK
ncbi:unknown [Acetobacter sp. CAG:977]|nr:unknown [Acetobacter sp. CAG:977]DAI55523.1 MAG TPA: hypothetical protein [Caudoviricetes sp.]